MANLSLDCTYVVYTSSRMSFYARHARKSLWCTVLFPFWARSLLKRVRRDTWAGENFVPKFSMLAVDKTKTSEAEATTEQKIERL